MGATIWEALWDDHKGRSEMRVKASRYTRAAINNYFVVGGNGAILVTGRCKKTIWLKFRVNRNVCRSPSGRL